MMPEALGAAAGAGAGASSSLLDLLAPLDYPRQSLWNAVYSPFAAAGNGDYTQLMRALPGLIGGGAGAMLGGFPGAVLGAGAAQGLARLTGSSLFDAPTGGDAIAAMGGDKDSIGGMIGGMGLQMAGDPLTFLGASMGARAAGPNKLPGGSLMGPKLPGGVPEMPPSIPTQFDAIPPAPRQWPTMGYDAQLNPIPATSFGAHTYGPPTMSDAAFLRAQAGKEGAESLMGASQYRPGPVMPEEWVPSERSLERWIDSIDDGGREFRFDPNDIRSYDAVPAGPAGPLRAGGNLGNARSSIPYEQDALLSSLTPEARQALTETDDYLKILADAYEEGTPALNNMRLDAIRRFWPGQLSDDATRVNPISRTLQPFVDNPNEDSLQNILTLGVGLKPVIPLMSNRAQYGASLLHNDVGAIIPEILQAADAGFAPVSQMYNTSVGLGLMGAGKGLGVDAGTDMMNLVRQLTSQHQISPDQISALLRELGVVL